MEYESVYTQGTRLIPSAIGWCSEGRYGGYSRCPASAAKTSCQVGFFFCMPNAVVRLVGHVQSYF
jgi:hypothetical protein